MLPDIVFFAGAQAAILAYDDKTAERVRSILSARRDVVEKKMMGGMCFMVRGSMCCVSKSALMVRVGHEAYEGVLTRPHVRPLEFAARRPKGFVLVDPEGYRTDTALKRWIQRGIDFVSTLPAKESVKKRSRKAPL